MQSNILNPKIVVCISMIALLILRCNSKTDLNNQITIKINSINSETKQLRLNSFDKIEVSKEGIGYLMKTLDKVGEYTTDSTGSVKIKIDHTEEYHFILSGPNVYGSIEFSRRELKDGQEVNIEVISLEKR